jgi:hypothetical protein
MIALLTFLDVFAPQHAIELREQFERVVAHDLAADS